MVRSNFDFDNTAIAAYHFDVGNGGSMRDGIWRNETSFSSLFSPGWEARDGDNFIVKIRYQF